MGQQAAGAGLEAGQEFEREGIIVLAMGGRAASVEAVDIAIKQSDSVNANADSREEVSGFPLGVEFKHLQVGDLAAT
eukprot:7040678-Prymnesium_polylepis.1